MVVIEVSAADKEFEDLCFEFGVELDDIVSVVSCFWVEFVNPGTSHAHHSVRVELVGSIIWEDWHNITHELEIKAWSVEGTVSTSNPVPK
jgi:hypothetical protein